MEKNKDKYVLETLGFSYLGLVKNKSDARIFGDWVVCLFVCSGTAGRALNVVVGTNWSSNANPFSSGCDC